MRISLVLVSELLAALSASSSYSLVGTLAAALAEDTSGDCSEDECSALLQVRGSAKSSGEDRGEQWARCDLHSNSPEFDRLVTSCAVLAEKDYQFAHEAPVYIPSKNIVLFASNKIDNAVELSYVNLKTGKVTRLPRSLWEDELPYVNGGTLDFQPGSFSKCADKADSVLLSSQGTKTKDSGIFRLNINTLAVETVVDISSWNGQNFNSPNDLVIDPVSGMILFTDPIYGFFQDFRPLPELGNWVWGYSPGSGDTTLLADGFRRPNGIAFASQRGDVLLVTDTGYITGADYVSETSLLIYLRTHNASKLGSDVDPQGPRTVYAFDVKRDHSGQIISLDNRRTLFTSSVGIPDGIRVDCDGRIYVGVGNGVDIFDKDGVHLGSLKTNPDYGCANLVLVPRGSTSELIATCETQIYKFTLNAQTCSLGTSHKKPWWPWTGPAEAED